MANFSITQGDDWSRTLTFTDELDAALNLSSYTFAGKLKKGSTTATISFDTTNAATGVIIISLSRTITAALATGHYSYDIQYITNEATPQLRTVLDGRISIKSQVTT